ncbi:Myb domain protein [Ophiocordyceps camponoti-floridani]|uniref:Myb domain protein n=1 Tax=Ophiocordyceps camponoti-floridani TaxID=2030778 RepID=A0A8H4Q9C5_9HYPO|nr:Myb domain protein [Ophiocordyceps camponoti-floridani]
MSQTQMMAMHPRYSPLKDPLRRHEGGIVKTKKIALTGSGRAWREDEEAYLLQTRMQKMPYKHIAAHLNKTELACRLHYHQLSHGSTRRKRTTSFSSGSSDVTSCRQAPTRSPPSTTKARSLSPALAMGNYAISDLQLPSITTTSDRSPRLPAMLPKPEPLGGGGGGGGSGFGDSPPRLMAPLPPPMSLSRGGTPFQSPVPAPRLSPPSMMMTTPPMPPTSLSMHGPAHVDLARLQSIYESYKTSFWSAVADDPEKERKQPCYTPMTSHDKTRISSILG